MASFVHQLPPRGHDNARLLPSPGPLSLGIRPHASFSGLFCPLSCFPALPWCSCGLSWPFTSHSLPHSTFNDTTNFICQKCCPGLLRRSGTCWILDRRMDGTASHPSGRLPVCGGCVLLQRLWCYQPCSSGARLHSAWPSAVFSVLPSSLLGQLAFCRFTALPGGWLGSSLSSVARGCHAPQSCGSAFCRWPRTFDLMSSPQFLSELSRPAALCLP